MIPLTLLSPAKLNLFLHILGQRTDVYHQLQTLFQLLNYGDTLQFMRRHDSQIRLVSNCLEIADSDNLVIRAAKLLQTHTQCQQGADIKLDKILPIGGGLGGGSSNAATTLLALNQLWHIDLSKNELADLGLQLGADVPVFVHGRSALATGIGERLQAINLPKAWYLVIKPACQVSTAQIFHHRQLTRAAQAITIDDFFAGKIFTDRGLIGRNDCEILVRQLYSPVDAVFTWFDSKGYDARLTGTGCCVFVVFTDQATAKQTMQQLPAAWQGFVAEGINFSPDYAISGLETND